MNRLPGPSEQEMRNMLLMQQFLQQQQMQQQQQQQFIRQQQLQQVQQQRALLPQMLQPPSMPPQHLPFLPTAAMPPIPTVPGTAAATLPATAATASDESATKPNATSKSPQPLAMTDLPPGVLRVFQRLVGEAIADYQKASEEGGKETAEAVVIAIYEALLEACAPFGNVKQLLAPRERMMELIRKSLEFKLELQKNEAKGKSSDEKAATANATPNANTTAKHKGEPASDIRNNGIININAMRRYREGLATMQLQQQAARHNNNLVAASAQATNPWVGGHFSQQQRQQQQQQHQRQMQIQLLQAEQNQRREMLCWPGLDPITRARMVQEVLDRQAYLDSITKSPVPEIHQWNNSLAVAAVHQNLIVPPPSEAKEAQVTTLPMPKSSTTNANADTSAAEKPKDPTEASNAKPKSLKKNLATAEKTTTKPRTTLVKAKRRTALAKTKKKALPKKAATEKRKIANGGGDEGHSQPSITDKNSPVDLEDDDLVRNSFHEPASGFKPINGDDITTTDISEFGDASPESVEMAQAPQPAPTATTTAAATVQTPAPPPKKWNLDDSKLSAAAKRRLKRLAPFNSPGTVNKGECDFESVLGFTEDAGEDSQRRPRRRSRVAPELYQEPAATVDTKPKSIPRKKIARPKKKSKKTKVLSTAKTKKKTLVSTIRSNDNGDSLETSMKVVTEKKKKLKTKQKVRSSDSIDSTVVVATKKKPPEDLMNLLASKKTRPESVVAKSSKSPAKSARTDDISETVKTEQESGKLASGKRKLPSNHAELTASSSVPIKSSSSEDPLATAKATKKRTKSPLKKKKDGIKSASEKRKFSANHATTLPKAANPTSPAKKDKKARAVLERKRRKKSSDTSSPDKSSRKPKEKKVSTSLSSSNEKVKTPKAEKSPVDGVIPEYLPPSVQKALKRLAPHNVPGNVTAGDNAYILDAALHAPSGSRSRRSRAKNIDYSEL